MACTMAAAKTVASACRAAGAVVARKAAHNNAKVFARSALGARLKVGYYHLLVFLWASQLRLDLMTIGEKVRFKC